jgi:hypothetical protein
MRITKTIWTEVITVCSVLAMVATGSVAQHCIDYAEYLHWIGSVDTPGRANDVEIAGSYAFVADLSAGLQIYDISCPASPQLVGGVDIPDDIRSVDVSFPAPHISSAARSCRIALCAWPLRADMRTWPTPTPVWR